MPSIMLAHLVVGVKDGAWDRRAGLCGVGVLVVVGRAKGPEGLEGPLEGLEICREAEA